MKQIFYFLLVFLIPAFASGQFTYRATNASVFQTSYTELGSGRTVIPVADYDDTCSNPLAIPFTFNFNGINFNSFVLSTNGLIRLGNALIMQPDTDYLVNPLNNVIAPFNRDLDGDTLTEYSMQTTGSAPNRVLTVQFKNIFDFNYNIFQVQYSRMNFQIRLYEGSNTVEFIYGPFSPSTNVSNLILTSAGLKGSSNAASVNAYKSSVADYTLTAFTDGPYTSNPLTQNHFNNRNSVLPNPGIGLRFISAPLFPFDLKVEQIYTMGELPRVFGFPHTVSAVIKNVGMQTVSGVACTLRVAGANTFSNVKLTPSISPGNTGLVTFDPIPSFPNLGFDSVIVSLAPDSFNLNNSLYTDQKVTPYVFSYANSALPQGKAGFGFGQGVLMAKYYFSDSGIITAVRVHISNDPLNIGKKVYGCIQDIFGNEIGRSDSLIIQAANLNKYHDFILRSPVNLKNEYFFAGLAQYSMNTVEYYPVSYQGEGVPARPGTFYSGVLGGGNPIQESNNIGRFMIQALINDGLRPYIVRQPLPITRCAAVTDSLTVSATGINLRYRWYKNGVLRPNDTLYRIVFNPLNTADAGLYHVVVYNALDSMVTDTARVTVYALPAMTSASSKTICSGNGVALNFTSNVAGSVFNWIATDNAVVTGESTTMRTTAQLSDILVNPSVTGQTVSYTVTPYNNGCQGTAQSLNITVNPVPAMTNPATASVCSGVPLNILLTTGIPSSTLSWVADNNPNTTGETLIAKTTNIIKDTIVNTSSANATVTYRITPTAFGCTGTTQILAVTVNLMPRITGFIAANPASCGTATGSISLQGLYASRSYTVSYLRNGVTVNTVLSSNASGILVISNLNAAIYSAIKVVLGTCESNSIGPISLSDPQSPPAPVASSNSPVCSGDTLRLSAMPAAPDTGLTFQWSGPNGFSSTSQNISIPAATTRAGGVYAVYVRASGCNSPSASVVVQVDSTPVTPVASGPDPGCTGSAITLTASLSTGQAVTWSWAGPGGFSSTQKNPVIGNPQLSDSGNYSVVAYSSTGHCPSRPASFFLHIHPSPVITGLTGNNPTACGSATGSIQFGGMMAGEVYALQYLQNGNTVTGTFTADTAGMILIGSLPSGIYSSLVVQSGGCASGSAGPVYLSDPNAPPAPQLSSNSPVCEGGSIHLSAYLNSDSMVTYSWVGPNGFSSTQSNPVINTVTSSNQGNYSVFATVSGCISPAVSIPVQVYRLPVQLFAQDTIRVCGSSYLLTAQPGYTGYSWNTGASGSSINVSATGWYRCGVFQDTCRSADSVYVSLLDGRILNNDTAVCKGNPVILTATANQALAGSGNVITYLWSNNATASSIAVAPLVSTMYRCIFSNGISTCIDSAFITVKQLSNVTLVVSSCNSYVWNNNTYTQTGSYTYRSTNRAGCDSTTILQLTIRQSSSSSTSVTACDRYLWNGVTYYQTGIYYYVTTNAVNCDSIAALNLTIKYSTVSTTTVSNCVSYAWHGNTYTESGVYSFLAVNSVGCDSLALLNLTIKNPSSSNTTVSNCVSYVWNGNTYTQSGNYSYHTLNSAGCDSTAWLALTIRQATSSSSPVSACNSYLWNGTTYTQTGNYTFHTLNSVGCDSAAVLNLTIRRSSGSLTPATACDSYLWNAVTYTQSGYYTFHMLNAAGCDSAAVLNLTIKRSTSSTTTVSTCVSYTWNGNTYTQSGNYSFITMNRVGCDSTARLLLTIRQVSASSTVISSCNSYVWNTTTYTQSGNYTYHTLNSVGCDSAAVLNLTIRRSSVSATTISSCETFLWNGTTYTQSGNYTYLTVNAAGCDSTATLNLTIKRTSSSLSADTACVSYLWNGVTYTQSGLYSYLSTNRAGCDSTAVLNLVILPATASLSTVSACVSYTWNGITYTQSGNYSYHTLNSAGCDSTARLALTIRQATSSSSPVSACISYLWNGTTYTQTGNYTFHTLNSVGCDSAAVLNLTIRRSSGSLTPATACDSYLWNTVTYTQSGYYTFHALNAAGCDSAAVLNLTIKRSTSSTTTVSTCVSFTWNGNTYTQSGNYSFSTVNSVGCDSTARLLLTIRQVSASSTVISSCNSYVWNTTTYTQSGNYTYHTLNSVGCDSAAVVNLTIRRSSVSTTAISSCETFLWNGTTYTQSGSYTYLTVNAAGCDSTATLNLTIKRTSSSLSADTACVSYLWNGVTYTQSGLYSYLSTNSAGCDSTAVLNLVILPATASLSTVSACVSYTWNGNTYTQSGSYTFRSVNSVGCDSTAVLSLVVRYPTVSSNTASACVSYLWNGTTYTQSGSYTFHTLNAAACDSTAILNLTIRQNSTSGSSVAACASYLWNGTTYTQSGSYTFHSLNAAGCDSAAVLSLLIKQPTGSLTPASACEQYGWNGTTYTQSGYYTYHTTNAAGCDSAAVLSLTIRRATESLSTASSCVSYGWNGNTYTQSGNYSAHFINAAGCDSTAVLSLTIRQTSSSISYASACNSYLWNGTGYTQSGIYTFISTNAANCDSMAYLNLTIYYPTSSVTNQTACVSFSWNGTTYTQSGTYSYQSLNSHGCDSTALLNLSIDTISISRQNVSACISYTWNGNTYTQSGNYSFRAAGSRCDSIAVLLLAINQPSSSSGTQIACNSYSWHGSTYIQSGTYSYVGVNQAGCDSTEVLALEIRHSSSSVSVASGCNQYDWNGQTYTQSGLYSFLSLNAEGCDSTAYLQLTIGRPTSGSQTVSACDNYVWNGQTYTQSGVYSFFTFNAAGCDSTAILFLTVLSRSYSSESISVCGQYSWHGNVYTQTGSYSYNSTNSAGCDSVEILILTVRVATGSQRTAAACVSYLWNGNLYTQSGQYSYTTLNAAGCDSIVRLFLTILQPSSSISSVSACGQYAWHGNVYTQTGSYSYNSTNAAGCDSLAVLQLLILQPTSSLSFANSCVQYSWNGTTYTQSGVYTRTLVNAAGCDSIAVLNLQIRQTSSSLSTAESCIQYSWNGNTYSQSGSYTVTRVNAAGCDSFAILLLTVKLPTSSSNSASACGQYAWNGNTYTQSGTYSYSGTNSAGCDSTAILSLVIKTATGSVTSAAACVSYSWNGNTYTQSGVYTAILVNAAGCDSLAQLDLEIRNSLYTDTTAGACGSFTWRGTTYTQSGVYSVSLSTGTGCDTMKILHLSIGQPPVISVVETPMACFGGTATVTVSATQGLPPYTGTGIFNVVAGNYTYTVSDASGCTASTSVTITQPDPMTSFINTSPSGTGMSNGTAVVTVTGGVAPYSYSWSNGDTGDTARNLAAGNYTVTVTDSRGCVIMNNAVVSDVRISCKGFVTYTRADWHANTAGIYGSNHFAAYFPAPGYLTLGCSAGNRIRFDNYASLKKFLLSEGPASVLPPGLALNPDTSLHNSLAAELAALTLNMVSDSADGLFSPATPLLKDLKVLSGPFAGKSVRELYVEANNYLGNCSSAYTGQDFLDAVSAVNRNFEDGRVDLGYLACLPSDPPPDMDVTRFNGEVSIYPNPTYGPLVVRFSLDQRDRVIITLYDSKGALLYKNDLGLVDPGYTTVHVPALHGRSAGIYMLKLMIGSQGRSYKVMMQ